MRIDMRSHELVDSTARCTVEGAKGASTFRLTLSLGDLHQSGDWVIVADGAHFDIKGADEMAAAYHRKNWLCGVATGSRYAFRTLEIPFQRVNVRAFVGHLGSADLEATSLATSIAIAKLAGGQLPDSPTDGWDFAYKVWSESSQKQSA